MGWLGSLRLRRAARRYGRLLGPRLARDHGAAGPYTPEQIRAAVREAGLSEQFIVLAYAAFLTEDAFRALGPHDAGQGYDELRAMVHHHLDSPEHASVGSGDDDGSIDDHSSDGMGEPSDSL